MEMLGSDMINTTTLALLAIPAGLAFYIIFIQKKRILGHHPAIRTTVPGIQPANKKDGNLAELEKAGNLHKFLVNLHAKYGPLASFWHGEQLTISVASPHLFNQVIKLFDRPLFLFEKIVDVCGPMSITFMNGEEVRRRRAVCDRCFTHQAVKPYYKNTNKYAVELVDCWSKMSSDHRRIPLMDSFITYTIPSSAVSLFGEYLQDDRQFYKVSKAFDVFWGDAVSGRKQVPVEERQKVIAAKQLVEEAIRSALEYRVANPASTDKYLLIDALNEVHSSPGPINDDAVTYFFAALHTSISWLTWATYYIATHPDVLDKAYDEIKSVLGEKDVDWENCAKLVYLRQVVDETQRCSVLSPATGRYSSDEDITLEEHLIPAGTPIVIALGVSLQDEEVWPQPTKFDPERFNATNSKERPNLAFVPFGFAGGRKCPGFRYAYASIMTCLAHVIRRFKITLVEGQNVKPVYGLATQPAEEIWVTVEERSPTCRKTEP